jgi:FkbM family methyltransferase
MKFFRKLRRSIRKRVVTIRHGDRQFVADYLGADFLVRLDDGIGRELAFRDFERDRIEHFMGLCTRLRPDVFVDLGANVGTYTCILVRSGLVPRAIAFEPDPRNAIRLRANLLINGILDRVDVFQMAVGRAPARLWLEPGPDGNFTNARLAGPDAPATGEGQLVDVVRLDDAVPIAGTTIAIKIDIEGHECEALAGMERVLAGNRGVVQIETYDNAAAVAATMQHHGFRLEKNFAPDFVFVKE